jgi:hypothetical protein
MADEELTQRVNSTSPAPSPADEDKTQVVPRMTPTDAATAVDPEAEEKTTLVASQPPPTPRPATAPPPPPAGQQHRAAPAPRQSYGPPASAPPPPHGGPGRGAPPPPPPPGYGPQFAPPPGYGAQFAPPPPQQGYTAGGPTPPPNGYGPNATQNPMDAANALLAKGNSLIAKLMYRGIRGELIRQPWFVNYRQQSADQFVYVTYGIGVFVALVASLLPGFIGTVIIDVIFAGLIYLYFALGTKLAHQFVAYGICGVGAVIALLRALYNVATVFELASSPYMAGYAIGVLVSLAITVVSGLVLAYIGFQVYRGIQRLSSQ